MSETFEPSPPNPDRNPTNLTALKVPPHSVEAEQAVLGGLMIDNNEWENVADVLLAEDFYRPEHQIIFQAMTNLSENRKPIDVVTIAESLDHQGELEAAGGLDYLSELVGSSRGTANFETYTEIIRNRAILRRLISAANEIADSCYNPKNKQTDEIVDDAEKKVFDINNERPRVVGPEHIKQIVARTVDRIDEIAGLDGDLTGLSSGFVDLDKITAGWQKSDLVIVAGRPSMGKTAFAMNLVENAIQLSDDPIVVFSLEMPAESLVMRMLSSLGRIDQTKLRTGQLTEENWQGFNKAAGILNDKNLFIDDSPGVTPMEMRARLRRIHTRINAGNSKNDQDGNDKKAEKQIGMVVVDYLQLMQLKTTTENRVGEISEISRSLKLMAREFNCPVIALSQLNRGLEQRPNKRPVMSDLRESGAIEQDADLIAFIYRDEVYNEDSPDKGIAEVIIGKHRNGPIGAVRLSFLGQFTRFESHAQPRYDDSYTHG